MLPRFFCPGAALEGVLTLSEEDSHHIRRVLRMRKGEKLIVCDGQGQETVCILNGDLKPVAGEPYASKGEPQTTLHLYPSLSKGERMEWLLQKAVELGVGSITPVLSARCIAKSPDKAKQERWRRILKGAAEQCGRAVLPQLRDNLRLEEALCTAEKPALFCYEEEKERNIKQELASLGEVRQLSVFTGPEGGYEEEEVALAQEKGCAVISLGERILRSETAPLLVLSAVLLHGM